MSAKIYRVDDNHSLINLYFVNTVKLDWKLKMAPCSVIKSAAQKGLPEELRDIVVKLRQL